MVRTLPAGANAEKESRATSLIYILKLEFPAPVGTKYYSDMDLGAGDASSLANAQGRVKGWGDLIRRHEKGGGSVSDISVEIVDTDQVLLGYMRAVKMQHVRADLYMYFNELVIAQAFIIASGEIQEPLGWARITATVRFDVTDLAKYYDKKIGVVADRDVFPGVSNEDEDKILPLVYGKPSHVQMVHAVAAPECTLALLMRKTDMVFYVDDSSDFPQNVPITVIIPIGEYTAPEYIDGSFNGNTFTITQRGAIVVGPRNTTAEIDINHIEDNALGLVDNQYIRFMIAVTSPNDGYQERRIFECDAANDQILYVPGFIDAAAFWPVPNGFSYVIKSEGNRHRAGSKIILAIPEHVYIANMVPSVSVVRVYGYGTTSEQSATSVQIDIDPTLYTINRNDNQFGLTHNTTTITFARSVLEGYDNLQSETLFVELEGADTDGDGTGTLIENPSDVISDILTTHLGVPGGTLDAASFAAAKAAITYKCAFAYRRMVEGVAICANLAFQARCALMWDDDEVRLVYLNNLLGASAATVAASHDYDVDGTEIMQTPAFEVASEFLGRYSNADGKQVFVRIVDAAVEALYGRRIQEYKFWAYQQRVWVETVSTFWLTRLKYAYELVRLNAFMSVIELQRQDVITLDDAEFWGAGQKGRVLEIEHVLGSGEDEILDTLGLVLQLPRVPGCAGLCETACEGASQADCDLVCQTDAEIGCNACEVACQGLCQLTCVTVAQFGCTVGDTLGTEPTSSTTSTTSTTTTITTTTTTAGPENECNEECDPKIPDILYVTLSGYGGSFSGLNGAHTLHWVTGCDWIKQVGIYRIHVIWDDSGSKWFVDVSISASDCYLALGASPPNQDPCDPRDTYDVRLSCDDTDCDDEDTCEESLSAVGVVSYTP